MFLKDVSYGYQGCIYLFKDAVKTFTQICVLLNIIVEIVCDE